jgi:hypothetical protein
MAQSQTWKETVRGIVQTLPREFSLADVLAHHDELQRRFPNNRFIDAKVRQSLQVLRDQGLLCFVRPGQYERTDVLPVFSPLLVSRSRLPLSVRHRWRASHWRPGHHSTYTA